MKVRKKLIILVIMFSMLTFAFQVIINKIPYNISLNKEKFAAIEIIPPFQNISYIKVITESGTYLADKYDVFENSNGAIKYKGSMVKNIEIVADLINNKEREIWISWEGTDFIKNYLENYSKLFNVSLKILEIPKISTKLVTMSKSGLKLPDVVMVSAFDFPTYKELGILKDNSFIPFYYDTQVVYVNADLVNLNKLEWTIDEFESICNSLIKNNIKPVAINPISAYWFSTFLMGYGKIPLINNNFILTDDSTKKAIQLIMKWYNKDFFDFSFLNRDAQLAAFMDGKVGFLFQGSFLLPKILEKMDNIRILPLPKPMIPFKDYKGFATTKDGSLEFTMWLSTFLKNPLFEEEFSKKYVKFFDNYISESIPFRDTFIYTSKIAQPIPYDERYVKFHKNIKDILILIINGSISIEEGTTKLEEIVNNE